MTFSLGDRVYVQDIASKTWNIPATVKEGRVSEDGSTRSFLVEREDGVELLRNSRFLKHEWRNPRGKKPRKQVSWQDADLAAAEGTSADGAPAPAL